MQFGPWIIMALFSAKRRNASSSETEKPLVKTMAERTPARSSSASEVATPGAGMATMARSVSRGSRSIEALTGSPSTASAVGWIGMICPRKPDFCRF